MGMKRRVRRFSRQYLLLTARQQWACDRRAYVLSRMRQHVTMNAHPHAAAVDRSPGER